MEVIETEEFKAFLDALSAYYKVVGTLEPLAQNAEDNRAHSISANYSF
ncbi:hypothetical protein IHZ75_004381 [Salmonella enterica]|nr:hypothetical protein [Salmonella enterica]